MANIGFHLPCYELLIASPPAKDRKLGAEVLTPDFELELPEAQDEFSPTATIVNKSQKQKSTSLVSQHPGIFESPAFSEISYTQNLEGKVGRTYKKVKQFFNNPSDDETESEDSEQMSPALIHLPVKKLSQEQITPVPPMQAETLLDFSVPEPDSVRQGNIVFLHLMHSKKLSMCL